MRRSLLQTQSYHKVIAWIKSYGPPLLVVCYISTVLCTAAEQETWNRIFHRDFEMSLRSWSYVIEPCAVGCSESCLGNRRTHFLAWHLWERLVISVYFFLEAVWGLFGPRFFMSLRLFERGLTVDILSIREDSVSDKMIEYIERNSSFRALVDDLL